jgi:hypothetical protein
MAYSFQLVLDSRGRAKRVDLPENRRPRRAPPPLPDPHVPVSPGERHPSSSSPEGMAEAAAVSAMRPTARSAARGRSSSRELSA